MADIDLTPPLAVRLAYQDSQMATGTYTQGGSQVFSHLVTPPTTGVAAETAADADAQAVGFPDPLADTEGREWSINQNRDYLRDADDEASGNHFTEEE